MTNYDVFLSWLYKKTDEAQKVCVMSLSCNDNILGFILVSTFEIWDIDIILSKNHRKNLWHSFKQYKCQL